MGTAVSVGITNKAIVLFKDTFGYSFLSRTLLFTFTDGNYFSDITISPALPLSPSDKNLNVNLVSVLHWGS